MARRGLFSVFLMAIACSLGASPANAQTAAGAITGVVRDQAGAAVPGATITVTETRTNLQRVVMSTRDGVYTAASLAPGEYRLDLELAGFKPVRREGVRLSTGEKARIDFDLSVGDVREQVTVVAQDSPIVRAETASLGTVVENEQVVRLPLNGRLFIMLAAIAPGVALPPNSVLPRINGGRPRTNEYLFDGISVLQPEPGQLATIRSSTPSRSSRSKATARRRSSGDSMAAWSTSRRSRAPMPSTATCSSSFATSI